jgi:Fe-S-cluster containining protein
VSNTSSRRSTISRQFANGPERGLRGTRAKGKGSLDLDANPAKRALPLMPACTSCGNCCGPAHATADEAKKIKRYLKGRPEKWRVPGSDPVFDAQFPDFNDPLRCGFLRPIGDGTFRCAVYEVRPWVCRAYGVVIQLQCPLFPESAVIDFPTSKAYQTGVQDQTSKLLGQWFEEGYSERLTQGLIQMISKEKTREEAPMVTPPAVARET